jgi:rhodanese-related sulfurtransferase/DNA-binding transcriptional ArsR family regulator
MGPPVPKTSTKGPLYEAFAAVVKAMANPHRLELLDLLVQAPRTVEALAEQARLSVANASQHLQVLKREGLVTSARRGPFVTYRLAGDDVAEAVVRLRQLAEARSAALAAAASRLQRRGAERQEVDRAALLRRARRGEVLVLDVRPAEEYAAGHLPHARSFPLGELKRRLAELPRDVEVVAYCRGPFCVLARDAVALLERAGRKAVQLEDGVAEWRARGLPLAGEAPA